MRLAPPPLILLAMLAALALATPARGQIGISPVIQEVRLDEPEKVMAFRLTNFEDKPRKVVVTVANWTLDAKGEIRELPSDETSLDRWLIVSPLQFELKGKSVQTIRVAIRPAVALAPGEHRAMVYFHEVLPPRAPGETGIRGHFRVGAAVYAYQGEPRRSGRIEALTAGAQGLSAQLGSDGNAHARLQGFYAIWRAQDFPGLDASPLGGFELAPPKNRWPPAVVAIEDLPQLPVLPGIPRPLHANFGKLEAGRYVLEFRGGMSGKAMPVALPFTVPARKPGG